MSTTSSYENLVSGSNASPLFTQQPYDSPAHPLYLHPADQPGISLVPFPLSGANYRHWSQAMVIALNAKNKIGFVDGSIPMPSSLDSDFSQWSRCNHMVLSWLLNSLADALRAITVPPATAFLLWKDLKERYSQSNSPYIYSLEHLVFNLHQEGLSLADYFGKLKGYWDEIDTLLPPPTCTCGALKKEKQS